MKTESPTALHDALQACLRAVLAWHEQPISSASLQSRLGGDAMWSQDTLVEAADSLGYDVELGRIDPALPCLPPLPAICYTHQGTAVAVLAQDSEVSVLVVNPEVSDKPTEIPLPDLMARLSGDTLSLARRVLPGVAGDTTSKAQLTRHGHWFWGPIMRMRWVYLQVALAALLVNIFALASSVFSMIVYDRVIPNNATDTLIALLIGVTIIFVSDFIIRTVRGYFLDLASSKADASIADALFEQVLDAQLHTRRGSSGALASTMKEFESIRDFLTSATLTTFIDIPFSILFLVVIWLIGGPMVYVPMIAIPIMLAAGLLVQPQLKKLTQESQQDGHHKHAILVETLSGLETIKSLGAGALMRRRWQEAVVHQSHVGLKSRMLAQLATNVANSSQQFVQVAVVALGAFLVRDGALGFGAIIACTILSGRAIAPIAQITQLLTRMNQTQVSYRALNQLMQQAREHVHGQTYMARTDFKGGIEFRNVKFTYPGASKPTLDGVSFVISPGDKVAIVGKVGSGKTTVSKLILGLYPPDSGTVLMDGVDVRQIDPSDLRRALGVVLQEVWLMGGTIKQNIALGGQYPTDEEILRAAQISGVDDFVSQHPEGYGLRLGERGEGLSGGQRQAIAIARALLSKPKILLFDEATSAMDQGSEATLLQRLGQNLGDSTFITITHKASLLQIVNKIIVIDQGKVAMQGSPEQLMRAQQIQPQAK
ncbi:MAG: type I secretion system permease/ATPase [Rhodoferax sp.]|uniref:type I secretion system permease/ATPase n=1 Tax=Rhodoferax sp. TaxID=50421 RepID=UPI0027330CE0|nr:type I secretion system permease/ATPase [Rhodoferax sp.]MDP2678541.1 type I secretion system permease/ATPase [Rhodoferax sp.]